MVYKLVSLGDVANLFQTPGLNRLQREGGERVRVANIRNLEDFSTDGEQSDVCLDLKKAAPYLLHGGDVVASIRGVPMKAAVVTVVLRGGLAGQNLAVVRPSEQLNPQYLAALLRSHWLSGCLATLYRASAGTQTLTLSQLRKLRVPLPEPEMQKKLGDLFLATERAARLAEQQTKVRRRLTEASLYHLLGAPHE